MLGDRPAPIDRVAARLRAAIWCRAGWPGAGPAAAFGVDGDGILADPLADHLSRLVGIDPEELLSAQIVENGLGMLAVGFGHLVEALEEEPEPDAVAAHH